MISTLYTEQFMQYAWVSKHKSLYNHSWASLSGHYVTGNIDHTRQKLPTV